MPTIPMVCDKCGGKLEYNLNIGKYECISCNTWYILTEDTDFEIVADVLKKYRGRSSSVRVPEGVREIDRDAFYDLRVTEVILPSSLEKLNTDIFRECPEIKRIIISEGTKIITGKGFYTKWSRPRVEELEFPKSIEAIYYNPFFQYGVKRLKINREFEYYFKEVDYSSISCFQHSYATSCPWLWDSLESVETPSGTIDYQEYSRKCHERYMAVNEKKAKLIEEEKRQKLTLEEKRKKEEKEREELERKAIEDARRAKIEASEAARRASTGSTLSVIAFVVSLLGLGIFPCGALSIVLGVIDLILPSINGNKKTLSLIAIFFGIIEVFISLVILLLICKMKTFSTIG